MIAVSFASLLLAAMPMVHPTPAAGSLPAAERGNGAQIFATRCASCHGAQAWGGADGPSLRGVGLAAVDFWLTTGRMPAAVPYLQVGHRDERNGQRLSDGDIHAVEDYLAPIVAGGPAIPAVVANGDRQRGRALYEANCQQCHGYDANGGSIGELDWAPPLHEATIVQVAEAIRAGPGQMPQFGTHQLTQDELNDLASYVMVLRSASQPRDVPPFRSTGPVPEGAAGYVAILALIAFVFAYWRSDTPPAKREEAVRRDEGTME